MRHVVLPLGAKRTGATVKFTTEAGTEVSTVLSAALDILLHQLGQSDEPLEASASFRTCVANLTSGQDKACEKLTYQQRALALSVIQAEEADFHLRLDYNSSALTEEEVRRKGQFLLTLLDRLLADPGNSIATIDGVGEAETARIVCEFSGTASNYPRDARIETLFSGYAANAPDKIAILDQTVALTYMELDRRANELMQVLQLEGLTAGEPVVLLMPRVPGMVVATLAILKGGGVYVPIDPEYPQERIEYLIQDCGARFLITTAEQTDFANRFAGSTLRLDVRGALVGRIPAKALLVSALVPAASADTAGQAAYLMYTSGTTGQPKGVPVPHRGVVRLVCNTSYVRLDASTVMLQAGAVGFDATTFEIWGALLNGGRLCITDRATLLETAALRNFFVQHRVNTALLTTSLFAQHADRDLRLFTALDQLVVGGDVLPPKQARMVTEACPTLRLINAYGPTENAVISTAHDVSRSDGDLVPIGRPICNSTAYILNRYGRLQPIGVVGELYVGGDGVGAGYFRRPELTARAFVPNPFRLNETLYRTGDQACWRPDGTIEFHGRCDRQVKIRGHRIEPAEIERRLTQHPQVREAVVVTNEVASGERVLIAYFSVQAAIAVESLRQWLAEALPAPMMPAYFVRLDRLPLTLNGKVDRQALPAPTPSDAVAYVDDVEETEPLRDDLEAALLKLAAESMGVPRVSLRANLLGAGGSSLTAAILATRIERALGVRCTAGMILAATNFAALAEQLRSAPAAEPGIRPIDRREAYLASPQQRRVYFDQVKDLTATHYHLPLAIEFPTRLDFARLHDTLAKLVIRHPVLATYFSLIDGDVHQHVDHNVTIDFSEIECDESEAPTITSLLGPFDLGTAPLWRGAVVQVCGRSRLLFNIHHIICDGFSLALLFGEWQALYRNEGLPPLELAYVDYAEWVNGPGGAAARARQRSFWIDTLRPLPPSLVLPTDFVRHGLRRTAGRHVMFDLGVTRTASIGALARELSCTVFHVLVAAYAVWLGRATGQYDVIVGTPALGRRVLGSERLLGMFVNTVCLRLQIQADATVEQHILATAERTIAMFENQDYPFDDLVREILPQRDYSRNPFFDTMIALQNTGLSGMSFLGGSVRWVPSATGHSLFDLNLQFEELGKTLIATWSYASDLFLNTTVESFTEEYLTVLDHMLAMPQAQLRSMLEDEGSPSGLPDISFDL